MTPDDHRVERLGAYADRWLDGQIDEPTTAEEATFAHLQRVLGTTSSASSTHPTAHQETPMLPIASIQPPPVPTSSRYRSPVMATLSRWQPVFSMAVMFAILAGLVGIAYTGLNRQDREPESTMLAALPDDATSTSDACTPPPPSASDEDLLTASLSDWPAPVYFVTDYADDATADQVREALASYAECAKAIGYFYDQEQARSPLIRDYFSPRMRYLTLYDDLGSDHQAAIDQFTCRPKEQDALRQIPFTTNTRFLPTTMDAFDPLGWYETYDVFVLEDGRYGIALGSVSTETLRNPDAPVGRDSLGINILVEQDGHFYIDESFIAISADPSLYSPGQMAGDCD